MPATALGFLLSRLLVKFIDRSYARNAVLATCTASAGVLLVKALW